MQVLDRKRLSKFLLLLAAWIATVLAVWAALAILNTILLVPGEHIWRLKLEIAGGLALVCFALVQTARWCFQKAKSV